MECGCSWEEAGAGACWVPFGLSAVLRLEAELLSARSLTAETSYLVPTRDCWEEQGSASYIHGLLTFLCS